MESKRSLDTSVLDPQSPLLAGRVRAHTQKSVGGRRIDVDGQTTALGTLATAENADPEAVALWSRAFSARLRVLGVAGEVELHVDADGTLHVFQGPFDGQTPLFRNEVTLHPAEEVTRAELDQLAA